MRKAIIIAVLLLVGFQAKAQVKIDVKTSFDVKEQFSVYKNGIIKMLQKSTLFEVVNTGEDYSLWITGFHYKSTYSGQRYISADIELRTPAFLTHGDLIERRTISDYYNPDKINRARDVRDLAQKMASMRKLKQLATKLSFKADKAAAGYALAATGGPIMLVFNSVISKINLDFGKRPTALDLSDSIYLGIIVTNYLYNTCY